MHFCVVELSFSFYSDIFLLQFSVILIASTQAWMVVLHAFSLQITIGILAIEYACKWSVTEFTTQHFLMNIIFRPFFRREKIFILQWRWTTSYFRANLHAVEYIMCSIPNCRKNKRKKARESNIKCSQAKKTQPNTIRTSVCCTFIAAEFLGFRFLTNFIHCIALYVRVLHPPQTKNFVFGGPGLHLICCCVAAAF